MKKPRETSDSEDDMPLFNRFTEAAAAAAPEKAKKKKKTKRNSNDEQPQAEPAVSASVDLPDNSIEAAAAEAQPAPKPQAPIRYTKYYERCLSAGCTTIPSNNMFSMLLGAGWTEKQMEQRDWAGGNLKSALDGASKHLDKFKGNTKWTRPANGDMRTFMAAVGVQFDPPTITSSAAIKLTKEFLPGGAKLKTAGELVARFPITPAQIKDLTDVQATALLDHLNAGMEVPEALQAALDAIPAPQAENAVMPWT
uniref:Uncharacterized protein n=1 Tax=Tetradesmus obliquus TaxID=3088 RepID=A0A383WPM1_TETOB|eukprot:jgi/Sobl393_1/7321/SZX70546.1